VEGEWQLGVGVGVGVGVASESESDASFLSMLFLLPLSLPVSVTVSVSAPCDDIGAGLGCSQLYDCQRDGSADEIDIDTNTGVIVRLVSLLPCNSSRQ